MLPPDWTKPARADTIYPATYRKGADAVDLAAEKRLRFLVCTGSAELEKKLRAGLRRWACGECVELSADFAPGFPQRADRADVLFLDMDSVDAPERGKLEADCGALIVLSGDAGRAIRSYRWHPAAFLKPDFDARRLAEALGASAAAWQAGVRYLESPYRRQTWRLPLGRLRFVEAQRHYCLLNQQRLSVRARFSLGELERSLPQPPFVRCHKSYLVHLGAVEKVGYTALTLRDDGCTLPVGRIYYDALCRALRAWREEEAL